jgi:hypothetical protein
MPAVFASQYIQFEIGSRKSAAGDASFLLESATTKAMPFITALHMLDGQVIEQRDFADYEPFPAIVRLTNQDG